MAGPGFGPDVLGRSLPIFHFFSQRPLHTYSWAPDGQTAKAGLFLWRVMHPLFFFTVLVLCVNRISSFPQITAQGVYLNQHSGNNNAFSKMMLLLVSPCACILAYLNSRKHLEFCGIAFMQVLFFYCKTPSKSHSIHCRCSIINPFYEL